MSKGEYKTMDRNLDGVYFRVEREGKWQNICFSDLTEDEMNEVMKDKSITWLRSMCRILGKKIKDIGNEMDIEIFRCNE